MIAPNTSKATLDDGLFWVTLKSGPAKITPDFKGPSLHTTLIRYLEQDLRVKYYFAHSCMDLICIAVELDQNYEPHRFFNDLKEQLAREAAKMIDQGQVFKLEKGSLKKLSWDELQTLKQLFEINSFSSKNAA